MRGLVKALRLTGIAALFMSMLLYTQQQVNEHGAAIKAAPHQVLDQKLRRKHQR